MSGSLAGKVAIVTGGSNGIGAAIVALFQEQGAKVASLDVVEQQQSTSDALITIKCNIASEEDIDAAVSQTLEKFGKLDILVNCAGVMDDFSRIGSASNTVWNRCLNVNTTGTFFLTRRCLPSLLESKGNIVNICSGASASGAAAGVAYTASKHAMLGMSRHTAYTYAKEGLRCNAILPGGIETKIMENSNAGWDKVGLEAIGPYHRCMHGTLPPTHVANAVLFLASAPSVNGAEVAVDLGWSAA